MRSTSLIALIAVTVLIGTAAVFTLQKRDAGVRASIEPQLLLPDLRESLNDVARVEVVLPTDRMTIVRDGEIWKLEEKSGYPIKTDQLRRLLTGLANIETLEERTANPELHGRLALVDPEEESGGGDDAGRKVVLKDAEGETLGAVILGKPVQVTAPRAGAAQFFVRAADERQTWLARGDVNPPPGLMAWLDTELFRLPSQRVEAVIIDHPDGETVTARNAAPDQRNFSLEGIPKGMRLISPSMVNSLTNPLSWFNFEDVRPASEVAFDENAGFKATFQTYDGMTLTIQTASIDEEVWVRLLGSFDEESANAAHERREAARQELIDGGGEPPATQLKTPAEVKAEVEALKAKVDGWVYRVNATTMAVLDRRMESMIQPDTPDAPTNGAGMDDSDSWTPMNLPEDLRNSLPPGFIEQFEQQTRQQADALEALNTPNAVLDWRPAAKPSVATDGSEAE